MMYKITVLEENEAVFKTKENNKIYIMNKEEIAVKSNILTSSNMSKVEISEFLFDEIFKKINIYSYCLEDKREVLKYSFFDEFDIFAEEVKDSENITPKKNEYFVHYKKYDDIASINKEDENNKISQILRRSFTLKNNENNCYDNADIKVVFAERGFAFFDKFENEKNREKFDKVLLQYLLGLAYNLKTESLLKSTIESFAKRNFNDMISIRDEIHAFNVQYVFLNPIKYNHQQQYLIWKLIATNYNVLENYNQMKTQVSDLTSIIEIRQREEKIAKEREKESKSEEKQRSFDRKMAWITGLIAIASLVSVVNDGFDLYPKIMEWIKIYPQQ